MDAHTLSLEQARMAKQPYAIEVDQDVPEPASEWFKRPTSEYTKTIPYRTIADHSDREYIKWRTPSDKIQHLISLDTSLDQWIRDTSEEEIARIIRTTPRGLAADPNTGVAFDFTPWQRISMAYYMKPFFACTSRVMIDTDALRDMAAYTEQEMVRARRIPISAELSTLQGTMRDFGIIDLPTAAGKTAWVLSVLLMVLSNLNYSDLLNEFHAKLAGVMFKGPSDPKVARMAVVAAAGTTFDHFVKTLERLIPRFTEVDPSVNVVVWKTMSKHYSVEVAYRMPPNTIVVWIVPPVKLNAVLREHPDVTIPVTVIDEYTQDTPRERYVTDRSYVMKKMIAQATPQALQNATRGAMSDLKEIFGGFLYGPYTIERLLRRRDFKEATIAVQQLCKLDQMTLTPFRSRVRNDLAALVPSGLLVTFVKSRRVTVASHILESEVDMVPASLTNVILAYLRPFNLDTASRERIQATITDNSMAPTDIMNLLDTVNSAYPNSDRGVVNRLKDRITEFTSSCPICMNEETSGIHVMGCCGYCLCDVCFHSTRNNRCAFCRTEIPSLLPRNETETEEVAQQRAETVLDQTYPSALTTLFDPPQMRRNTQVANLTHTLHHARNGGLRRLLVIVERNTYGRDLGVCLDVSTLSSRTGIEITRVDDLIRGKGTQFAKVKAEFDSPNPQPMCLMCYGIDERFLVGTDLAHADCLITVGSISDGILTQTLGRVLRPRRERDNHTLLNLYKIYTGSGRFL